MENKPGGSTALRRTDRSLPIALLRARETVMEPLREMLARSRISEQKWRILRVVDEAGPIEQTKIAKRACLLLPSLTRIIRSMETDGLLERAQDVKDRRKSMVTITGNGRAIILKHAQESNAIFASLEDQFGETDLNTLLDLLERFQQTDFRARRDIDAK